MPTDSMTPAEFKTHLEAMGLTNQYVAECIGVSVTRVYLFGDPRRLIDVTEPAAKAMRELADDFESAADRLTELAEAPEIEALPRHLTEAEFWEYVPELQGWPLSAQPMLLAEVLRRCAGRTLRVEYVTPELSAA